MDDVRNFDNWTLGMVENWFYQGALSSAMFEAYRYLWNESHGRHVSWTLLPDDTRALVNEYRDWKLKGDNA